jgi:hypothetical protein
VHALLDRIPLAAAMDFACVVARRCCERAGADPPALAELA